MTTNLLRKNEKQNVDLVLLLTDISALLCLIVFFAFRYSGDFTLTLSQLAFLLMSLLYAYLRGLKINILFLWAAAFYGFCALSTLWAYTPAGSGRLAAYSLKSLSMIFSVLLYADTKRNANILVWGFIIGAAILAIRLLINTPLEEFGAKRLGEAIDFNENTVGMLFLYSAAISLYFTKKSKWFFAVFLLSTVFVLLSGSRKSAVMIVALLLISFFNKIEKPVHMLYIIPFGAAIAALIYLVFNNEQLYHLVGRRFEFLFNYFSGEGEVGSSTFIRMSLIDIGVTQFKEKPILGYGFNNFRYMNDFRTYAHNNFIELLVNTGIVGTVLFYSAHLFILVKAAIIWFTKTREVIIAIMFLAIILICDYGAVSYYNEITLAVLALSYKLVVLTDNEKAVEPHSHKMVSNAKSHTQRTVT